MKKKVSLAIGLLSFVSLVTACSNKTTINWKDYRLENVGDYTAFGCGSISDKQSETKGKKARLNKDGNNDFAKAQYLSENNSENDNFITDSSPITLIGLTNGKVKELGFTNGESNKSITIDHYGEFGDFIYFTYFDVDKYIEGVNYNAEHPHFNTGESLTHTKPEYSYDCQIFDFDGLDGNMTFLPYFETWDSNDNSWRSASYLFSKKTGKIYAYTVDSQISSFAIGGDIIYSCVPTVSNDHICKIVEENETMQFVETKIPSEYLTDFVDDSRGIRPGIDKYGNLLTAKGIITPDMKIHKFSSYFDGGTFDLNSQKQIVHFSKDHLKVYVLDSEGQFVEDQSALKGLVFEKIGLSYNSDNDLSKEEYLKQIGDDSAYDYFDYITYDEFDNVIGFRIKNVDAGEDYYTLADDSIIYKNNKYAYALNSFGFLHRYSLDDRGFYILDGGGYYNSSINSNSIWRGNCIYYYNDEGLRKFDMSKETDEELSPEYSIKGIGIDEYGRIIVNCLDEYFNEFVGYLEMDDTISLEAKEVPELTTYVLYPVN